MNRVFQTVKSISVLVAVLLMWNVDAQSAEMNLGYCDGLIAVKDGHGTITGRPGSGEISMAIFLTPGELNKYIGNSLSAVRVGIPQSDKLPESITGWVKKGSLDSEPSATGVITPESGWNRIQLDEEISIDSSDMGLWVGVTYSQSEKLNIISFAGETYPDACWIAKNDAWTDFATKGFGSLSIEGVVSGENMPKWNLGFKNVYAQQTHIHIESPLAVSGSVVNQAAETVEGYYLKWSWDHQEEGGSEYIANLLATNKEGKFSIEVPSRGLNAGVHTLRVGLMIGDGREDEDMTDNVAEILIEIYETGFPKTLLLEQFTSEFCGYCPTGIAAIHDALEMEKLTDRVVWVSHHVGYHDDWLTSPSSRPYLDLYGTPQTFAPAMTLNRTYVEGHSGSGPVGGIGDKYDVADWLWSQIDGIAYAGVEISSFTIEGDELALEFDLKKDDILDDLYGNLYVTAFILEEDIPQMAQMDYAGNKATGIHEGTLRTELSTPWGDLIDWHGSTTSSFSYHCVTPEDWNKENLRAVVFINKYDEFDINSCEVLNCGSAFIKTAGVDSASADNDPVLTEYYTLSGCRVERPMNGVLLKVTYFSDGTKKSALIRNK